ncbi:hypothetical protein J2X59_001171 [Flavobacterium sp. 260]|nr:hypothetical protein [Curtobacterium sp. 260]
MGPDPLSSLTGRLTRTSPGSAPNQVIRTRGTEPACVRHLDRERGAEVDHARQRGRGTAVPILTRRFLRPVPRLLIECAQLRYDGRRRGAPRRRPSNLDPSCSPDPRIGAGADPRRLVHHGQTGGQLVHPVHRCRTSLRSWSTLTVAYGRRRMHRVRARTSERLARASPEPMPSVASILVLLDEPPPAQRPYPAARFTSRASRAERGRAVLQNDQCGRVRVEHAPSDSGALQPRDAGHTHVTPRRAPPLDRAGICILIPDVPLPSQGGEVGTTWRRRGRRTTVDRPRRPTVLPTAREPCRP